MKGALPPSSSDTLFSVLEQADMSIYEGERERINIGVGIISLTFPVSVDPVNDIFLTLLSSIIVSLTAVRPSLVVMTLHTPLGTPASSASCGGGREESV